MEFGSKNYSALKHDFNGKKKRMLTTEDLCHDLKAWLTENATEYKDIESILDYFITCKTFVPNYEDDVQAIVNTGGNEGIYIDVIFLENRVTRKNAITIKTLSEGFDAYVKMGMLSGMLTVLIEHWMWQNSEFLGY